MFHKSFYCLFIYCIICLFEALLVFLNNIYLLELRLLGKLLPDNIINLSTLNLKYIPFVLTKPDNKTWLLMT